MARASRSSRLSHGLIRSGFDELVGHKPVGILRGYIAKMILSSGAAMSAAQRKVSKRIVGLLGLA
jgi:hypothetical protein